MCDVSICASVHHQVQYSNVTVDNQNRSLRITIARTNQKSMSHQNGQRWSCSSSHQNGRLGYGDCAEDEAFPGVHVSTAPFNSSHDVGVKVHVFFGVSWCFSNSTIKARVSKIISKRTCENNHTPKGATSCMHKVTPVNDDFCASVLRRRIICSVCTQILSGTEGGVSLPLGSVHSIAYFLRVPEGSAWESVQTVAISVTGGRFDFLDAFVEPHDCAVVC